MNQLTYPLFVSDIDGTLISSDQLIHDANLKVPDANLKSIEEFRRQGGLFTLATGRSYAEAKRLIEFLDIQLPVILCNGGMLYHPKTDQLTPVATLEQTVVTEIISQLTSIVPSMDLLVYTTDRIYSTGLSPIVQAVLQSDFDTEDLMPLENLASFADLPTVPWIKICVVGENRWMKDLHKWADSTPFSLEVVQSSDNFFEILPVGVSKGAAVVALAESLGLPPRSAAVIGDHMNDLSMTKVAGTSAAMANAHPSLLQAADHITLSNDEAGLSYFINNHLLSTPVNIASER
ncbi:hypothetical protein SAMN05444487_12039 [Marininema mesophilum]|uniref:Cof subfamily of IIB subfamily of haloacid dehalogenase superfamily/HAD-superfamily hydrolase, subfamily IIB n=1 Tax=Marininema mesophilum TaxID=1048340 RepID=A0A1H3C778_9BACL|nr:Cof-type HAD-IIB family hydrolase [Marininema mesophilum]SDX49941.1 hypothetical protein SAMN05444487_12039 [Marininema mesophilum]